MSAFHQVRTANEKGQTLLEVLAASVLIMLLCGSILAIFSPVAHWIATARSQTMAANYAIAILESLRSQPDMLQAVNAGQSAEELGLAGIYSPAGMANELTCMEPRADYTNLYEVMVTVYWVQGAEDHQLQFGTVIRKE